MKTLKWNGEYWYEDRTPLLSRLASWFLWVGGTRQHPTPVSLLGNLVTFYDWGAELRLPDGDWLVVSWCGADRNHWWRRKPEALYISPNGTPSKAHTWFIGAPREIAEAAAKKAGRNRTCGAWQPDSSATHRWAHDHNQVCARWYCGPQQQKEQL
jgi:hypothetical protein